MIQGLRRAALGLILAVGLAAAPAHAADPKFPALTGRVVDQANLLSPETEATLTAKLQGLEQATGRQVVVATVGDLQGLEIEDYGYRLGRTWGLGDQSRNDGAILLVAPSERKVRIEVGYGLEPILTDALASVILQQKVLPRFREGQLEAGVVAGADALVALLSLPDDQAQAQAKAAAPAPAADAGPSGLTILVIVIVIFLVLSSMRGRRRRRSGLGSALPWIVLGNLGGGRGGWSGGGGSFGGGGGFSGGGGSFGGGGASGSW